MKLLYKILITSAVLLSFQVQSGVKVHFHRDLAPVVIDGEEVGFSVGKKSSVVLENGINQIVVRVSKLVAKQGEHEKFNSEPIVVTFDAKDTELTLNPTKVITRVEQIGSFGDNPKVEMFDKEGHAYLIQQGILKRGSGLTRDYERELAKFNKKNDINLPSVTAVSNTTYTSLNEKASSALNDLKLNFAQLTPTEKKEFLMWAVGQ
ncbi:DUF2057 domain-containing protein [Vibrio sp. S9_S30]|uniref:YccT family protein n=1 Tax=Vibrio sp. S9_S30 TaxID=2720226 RepID=UPI001681BDBE|nr:DUF2057 family protein [Vibrio sp. S9_S30]MBD1559153.1 DUF2057 domain-containing protein [Vibrio sp. S9_S30]